MVLCECACANLISKANVNLVNRTDVFICLHIMFQISFQNSKGSAVAWWLMPRTPDPEVRGSSPARVKPCCVLEQGAFTPQKYW